jgi:hypothetical protein
LRSSVRALCRRASERVGCGGGFSRRNCNPSLQLNTTLAAANRTDSTWSRRGDALRRGWRLLRSTRSGPRTPDRVDRSRRHPLLKASPRRDQVESVRLAAARGELSLHLLLAVIQSGATLTLTPRETGRGRDHECSQGSWAVWTETFPSASCKCRSSDPIEWIEAGAILFSSLDTR